MKPSRFPGRSRGFTLVELMVGVLIGLIGTVVIFQVFAVSESQKRTTTGSGDAQQNGVFTLFQIERDARMAGFAINHLPLLGCQTNGWFEATGTPINFNLLPIQITNGANGAPDAITIAYGDAELFATPEKISIPITSPVLDYRVRNRYGFRPGDVLIFAPTGSPCMLAQTSALPAANPLDIAHTSGTFTNPLGQIETTRFNRVGGLPGGTYPYPAWVDATSTGSRLYNLGQRPVVVRYSVVNSQLVATDLLAPGSADAASVLADGIVQLQAQYGFDSNGDGSIASGAANVAMINIAAGQADQWGDAMPAAAVAADWQKVIAVRLVAVARSMTPEKPDPVVGACTATTVNPKWFAPAPPVGIDVNVSLWDPANWRCFRYRTFEVVVPIRNMVWFPQPA